MAKNKIEKRKFIEDIFGMEVFSSMLATLRQDYNEISREHDTRLTKLEEIEKSYKNYEDQKQKILQTRKEKKEKYLGRQKDNIHETEKLKEELEKVEETNSSKVESQISALEEAVLDQEIRIEKNIKKWVLKKKNAQYVFDLWKSMMQN